MTDEKRYLFRGFHKRNDGSETIISDAEKEELAFAHKTAEESIDKYLERDRQCRELKSQIVEMEIKHNKEIESAQKAMAKKIFQEMYDIVNESSGEVIIVTADGVKRIAKRYGVEVRK